MNRFGWENTMRSLFIRLFIVACTSENGGNTPIRSFPEGTERLTVAFYNLENLFDATDDPRNAADDEYTPGGGMGWTRERMEEKCRRIARAIREMGEGNGPDILGVSEVENKQVLEYMVREYLPEGMYSIVHYESPDWRGMDVALLYKPTKVTVASSSLHPVPLPPAKKRTRAILRVEFRKETGNFTVLVNHWPSRGGGRAQTEPGRVAAAIVAEEIIDSIMHHDPNADVLLIGDLNDEPDNASVANVLDGMLNPGASVAETDTIGSYYYNDDWQVLDQILLTKSALDEKGIMWDGHPLQIFHPDFLRDFHKSQPDHPPHRTYIRRNQYIRGTSDHFPVFLSLGWR